MAILSGREKPLANDGRAGHLRGANSAAAGKSVGKSGVER